MEREGPGTEEKEKVLEFERGSTRYGELVLQENMDRSQDTAQHHDTT